MLVCVTVASLGYDLLGIPMTTAFLVPSGAALVIYAIGSAAGRRIFYRAPKSHRFYRWCAGIPFAVSLAILPFVGGPLAVAGALVGVVLLYRAVAVARRRAPAGPGHPGV